MLFCGKETRYWQEKYSRGEIPQEWLDDCCGETLALLDGTAERAGRTVLVAVCLAAVVIGLVLWAVL